ncbi:MAG: proline--tRNA ligase [Candidatus Marsarchaeota archaeon]|nr:proline--tRNA ligase [Candidatus Marsarchaeota archaeon]
MNISKNDNFSEWFTEIIKEAELADLRYNVKGFVVNMPWAVMIMKKMYALYEEELEKNNHLPAWFPAVIPKENFEIEKEHVEGFKAEVFWITRGGDKELEEPLALRPTSETAMYKMFSLWIQGKSDLPLKIYQSTQVWRHETKSTRPFLRGREFHWIESHCAFSSKKDAEDQVLQDMQMTENIMHQEFCIPFIFFQRPEWDKFPGAIHTYAADSLMPDGRILQQPSTHLLGQNFAKAFNITFLDENGKNDFAWQTCYGPAIWRMFASLISVSGDDRGLILPFKLAPYQIMIIPIHSKDDKKIEKKAEEVKKTLENAGFRARIDASNKSPGFKFNFWEMKGVPLRIELGDKELESKELTVAKRFDGKKIKIKEEQIVEKIKDIAVEIQRFLLKRADDFFLDNTSKAYSLEELEKTIKEKGGFVMIPFCSVEIDGKECNEKLKERLHVDVRGERFDVKENPENKKCVVCGKEAKHYVYVGKQY